MDLELEDTFLASESHLFHDMRDSLTSIFLLGGVLNKQHTIVPKLLETEVLEKKSSPWYIYTEFIDADAVWIWDQYTRNTLVFEFDFGAIIAGDAGSAFSCACNEDCVIDCDEVDEVDGCSSQVIDARLAASLTLICSSSDNAYFGGCEV